MAHMVDTKVLSVALSKVNTLNKNKDSLKIFLSDSYCYAAKCNTNAKCNNFSNA